MEVISDLSQISGVFCFLFSYNGSISALEQVDVLKVINHIK